MKKIAGILLLLYYTLNAVAQPSGYTSGTWTDWTTTVSGVTRHHGFYQPAGWDRAVDHTLIFWGGLGQDPSDFSSLDDATPGSLVVGSSPWNAITSLPGGGTIKWRIIVFGNQGQFNTSFHDDLNILINAGGYSLPADTADHTRWHAAGLSYGPNNMWYFFTQTSSPWRNIFGTTISMSCASISGSSAMTAWSTGRKHYVYYGNPAGDGNDGTPFIFSQWLYDAIAGTPNVDKRFKWNPAGGHNDNTWGSKTVAASCLYPYGTDTASNRWLWMIYAYGAPGVNLSPTANAGSNQVIVSPATSTTINGSGSTDADGSIVSYAWTKISGPSGGTISSASSASTTITGLTTVGGLYSYRLLVTDNNGGTDDDTIQVYVTDKTPSNNRILISTANNYFPWTAEGHMELLFNNNTLHKLDTNGAVASFMVPIKCFVELKDSVFQGIKLRFYNGNGIAAQNWVIQLYDSTRALRGTYSFDQTSLPQNGYYTLAGNPDTITTPVRYISFQVSSASSDVREIEIYGDKVAKASTFIPDVVTPVALGDPGIRHMGGSDIGNMDTANVKLASGKTIYPSFRSPTNMWVWNHKQVSAGNPAWNAQPITLTTYGDMDKAVLRYFKRVGSEEMLYINGASIKAVPSLTDSNYAVLSGANLNNYKDIPIGSDSTNPAQWALNSARTFKGLSALWGRNTSANLSSYQIGGSGSPDVSWGQDKIKVMEMENEPDKPWVGAIGWHSAPVLWAKYRSIYDSVKSVDPTMQVNQGALYSADTMKFKAVAFADYWMTGIKNNAPCDGFNFNMYISDAYSGQPQGTGAQAVSPEQFQVTERIAAFKRFRDRLYPGKDFRWTEIGFTSSASDYQVHSVTGIPDSVVVGGFQVRVLERAMMVPQGISRIYHYKHTSDGSGVFGGMYMVKFLFNSSSILIATYKRPVWYMYAQRANALWDYKGWSTTVTDGDSTGTTVVRRDHNTDPLKKAYTVWRGTYNGSTTSNYTLNIGNASAATLVTFQQNSETGTQTSLAVEGGNVTIPTVNELPQYVIVTLSDATPGNVIRKRTGARWNVKSEP